MDEYVIKYLGVSELQVETLYERQKVLVVLIIPDSGNP